VQITWLKNYQWLDSAAADADLTDPGEILADLDLAMRPDIAALALRAGLEEGRYDAQGKKMADRLPSNGPATKAQFVNARYLVNIQDKAGPIADVALMFQRALTFSASLGRPRLIARDDTRKRQHGLFQHRG